MPWNPNIYNQFKDTRFQPFFDLMGLISEGNLKSATDLGCGTGEQTKILSERFPNANFMGIDSSAEMLAKSKDLESDNLKFEQSTVEEFTDSDAKYDLIFSNAALQWSDNHERLFPVLLSKLSETGQFAVQMPMQSQNVLNQILVQLASEQPFKTELNGFNRISPLLTIDEYAQVLFDVGLQDLNISVRVYPIIANDVETLFNFISGSALIPYLERLNEEQQDVFTTEFKNRIAQKFKSFPAIYSFKRLLMYGRKV